MLNIKIILGSTREGRQGEKVARWITGLASQKKDLEVELLDLKDYPLPFLSESKADEKIVNKWSEKISQADGYIIVTPEYNHGYSAVLKNALDYLYTQWNNKPVGFASYSVGIIAGSRAVEQLRQVVIELQMAPIREAVYLPNISEAFDDQGQIKDPKADERVDSFLKQLSWWAKALKEAREK